MLNNIRWGILGTSFISEVMVKAIRESTNGHVVAVAGRTGQKVDEFANTLGITASYQNYQSLIDNPEIDAVYIGLPNYLHKEWIVNTARAGKHILSEKPFTISVKEAQEVIEVVNECKVFCMEAIMYRCHPFIAELKKIVNANLIGEIQFIEAGYTADIVDLANPNEGGAIRNLGCYPLSLIRYLMNSEPLDIQASGRINQKTGSDAQSTAKFKFSNARHATISTADDQEMAWKFEIHGDNGILKIVTNPWLPDKTNTIVIKHHAKEDSVELNFTAEKSLYTYQIDLMNDCIMRNEWPHPAGVPLSESLANTHALEVWRRQVCHGLKEFL